MNTHEQFYRLLPVYDILPGEERSQVDAHLAECEQCAAALDDYAQLDRELARLAQPWPDRRARTRLHEALARPSAGSDASTRRTRPWRLRMPAPARIALLVLAVFLLLGAGVNAFAQGRFDPRLVVRGRDPFLAAPTDPAGPNPFAPVVAPPEPKPADPVVAWIKDNAIPLSTTQAGTSYNDLMPLKAIVGDARIVAIGDSADGTHESLAMKQRLLEFLVKQLDFSILAVDTSGPQADLINDFVMTGEGDPERLSLLQTGDVRQTQELLYTMRWLRAYNENGDGLRLRFAGFDILQQYSHYPLDNVVAYLQRVAPDQVSKAYGDNKDLLAYLVNQRAALVSRSSYSQWGRAVSAVRALTQYDAFAGALGVEQRREMHTRFMVENVNAILRRSGPDGKIILWSRNSTVAVNGDTLGAALRARFGKDLVVIGSGFYAGSLNSDTRWPGTSVRRMAIHPVPPPPAGSYEDYFQRTGLTHFILNLRAVHGEPAEWLHQPHLLRDVVGPYDECYPDQFFRPVSLIDAFDAFIYLGNASPTTVLFQIPADAPKTCG